jgi:ornithine--oxo-acid transaminase
MTKSETYLKEVKQWAANNYKPLDVVLERGQGAWVWDVDGKKYLDCLSAYSAVNQGHCNPRIAAAAKRQLDRLTLTARAFHNDQMGPFLHQICELAGFPKALPMNTGAEGVETAMKCVRKWGYTVKKIPDGKAEIIGFNGNFHGRTISVISWSSERQYYEHFGPLTPGFKLVPYGDADAVEKAITPNTCAVIVEPIQGEGGVIVPPQGYLKRIREICTKHHVLMVADEVQTGLGRTGKMFACQWENVKPDAMILGKALAGGMYPVSVFLATEEVMGVFKPGDHGSTFGGNPLGAAIAREALNVLVEEKLADRAQEIGEWFMGELRKIKSDSIKEVRGKGLLIGVEMHVDAGTARPYCEALAARGVLCKETHDQVVRFAPPLTVEKKDLEWALTAIRDVLSMSFGKKPAMAGAR